MIYASKQTQVMSFSVLTSKVTGVQFHHILSSLRNKRFRGVSAQISMFWPRENWGENKEERGGRGRGEKETLAVKPLEF